MLKKSDALMTEFDEELWNATIEKVMMHSEHERTFTFKGVMISNWKI